MQSKIDSLVETVIQTMIGFIVSFGAQLTLFPIFGIDVSFGTNFALSMCFTTISVVRGYFVRRLFNWMHGRGIVLGQNPYSPRA